MAPPLYRWVRGLTDRLGEGLWSYIYSTPSCSTTTPFPLKIPSLGETPDARLFAAETMGLQELSAYVGPDQRQSSLMAEASFFQPHRLLELRKIDRAARPIQMHAKFFPNAVAGDFPATLVTSAGDPPYGICSELIRVLEDGEVEKIIVKNSPIGSFPAWTKIQGEVLASEGLLRLKGEPLRTIFAIPRELEAVIDIVLPRSPNSADGVIDMVEAVCAADRMGVTGFRPVSNAFPWIAAAAAVVVGGILLNLISSDRALRMTA